MVDKTIAHANPTLPSNVAYQRVSAPNNGYSVWGYVTEFICDKVLCSYLAHTGLFDL